MISSFILVDQPWLPTVGLDGTRRDLSLDSLFRNAGRIRRLDLADPLERFAITRLLLAVMYAADVDNTTPSQYLDEHRELFDIMDPDRPFMQMPGMRPAGRDNTLGITRLHPLLSRPMWRPFDASKPTDPATTARLLVTCHQYDAAGIHTGMTGDPSQRNGKSYAKGVAQAGGLFLIHAEGDTLAETLELNHVPDGSGSRPFWETTPGYGDPKDPIAVGCAGSYTWPSRLINLDWDGDGMCRTAYVTNHWHATWHDKLQMPGMKSKPFPTGEPCAFRREDGKSGGLKPARSMTGDRTPLWMRWDRLMDHALRPPVVDHALRHHDSLVFETLAVQWGSQDSCVAGLRNDRLTIGKDILQEDPTKIVEAGRALRKTLPRTEADQAMAEWIAGGKHPTA